MARKSSVQTEPQANDVEEALVEPLEQQSQAEENADQLRHIRISEMAYYLAEQRGFEPGVELDNWLSAEAIVDKGIDS